LVDRLGGSGRYAAAVVVGGGHISPCQRGELDGAQLAVILEFQKHPVVTNSRHFDVEVGRGVLAGTVDGMHIQVSQVALAEYHQARSTPENRIKVHDWKVVAHHMNPYSRHRPGDEIPRPDHGVTVAVSGRRLFRYGTGLEETGSSEIYSESYRRFGGPGQELSEGAVATRLLEVQRHSPGAIVIHDGVEMLVAGQISAHDNQRHLPITSPDEVGHRLTAAGENGEPKILIFTGYESGIPGTQQVTLAGDGKSTGTLGVILVADAPPVAIMPSRRCTTDNRLAEIDPESEQRNQTGE